MAQLFDRQMQAAFACGFAIRHTGQRRTDGGGYTAGATAFTAFHDQQVLDDIVLMAGLEYALKHPF
ncbi:hypothetical protein A2T76_02575 [Pseudomonas brenneri]|nr:hypothetical protein A2T76_02575 [Pseudomonas brenneri]